MQSFPETLIVRHRKENLKKCSLRGLEKRDDMRFFTYPGLVLPDLSNYVLLALDAPTLTKEDAASGLLLLDATWRYAADMLKWVDQSQVVKKRTLPASLSTAYPRRQDVVGGLASVEALYAAYLILGRDPAGILESYYWAKPFLAKNTFIE